MTTTPKSDERAAFLAEKIRVRPTIFWRMQRPGGAYCMEWEWHEERYARAYYAAKTECAPSYAAQYEIKRVEVLTTHQTHCNEAADLLEQLAAPATQAAQAAQPTPKPLRGEQIYAICLEVFPKLTQGLTYVPEWAIPIARAVEAAHGIGAQE